MLNIMGEGIYYSVFPKCLSEIDYHYLEVDRLYFTVICDNYVDIKYLNLRRVSVEDIVKQYSYVKDVNCYVVVKKLNKMFCNIVFDRQYYNNIDVLQVINNIVFYGTLRRAQRKKAELEEEEWWGEEEAGARLYWSIVFFLPFLICNGFVLGK